MLFASAVYVGVNPSSSNRPVQYAALDGELRLLARGSASLEDTLAFIGGHESAIVAIDSPQGGADGLLKRSETREAFDLAADSDTWRNWRLCDFELRRRNIRLVNPATLERIASSWVHTGYRMYERLGALGFRFFRVGGEPARQLMLEVQPHAAYTALLKRQPFPKDTLEGRLQRQLVLFLEGLEIPNPMRSLEEVTRHHLLRGDLPLRDLFEQEHLDALAAAYTAFLVGTHTEGVTQVGDPDEGLITLPVEELKDFYEA